MSKKSNKRQNWFSGSSLANLNHPPYCPPNLMINARAICGSIATSDWLLRSFQSWAGTAHLWQSEGWVNIYRRHDIHCYSIKEMHRILIHINTTSQIMCPAGCSRKPDWMIIWYKWGLLSLLAPGGFLLNLIMGNVEMEWVEYFVRLRGQEGDRVRSAKTVMFLLNRSAGPKTEARCQNRFSPSVITQHTRLRRSTQAR